MIYTVTLNPALDRTIYVDRLSLTEPNRIQREERYAGGKGIDVSRALAALGVESVALGLVGGFDGKEFEGRLLNEGIACDFTRISGETRTNIVVEDLSTDQETPLLARGPEVQPFELVDFVAKLERLADVQFLVVSGSLPPGATPEVYRRIIQIGNDKGARTLLDTSGEALRHGLHARPALIKPNRNELSGLAGSELKTHGDILDFARRLTERVPTVLVSLGPEGIMLVTARQSWHAVPPRVEVKSTVGAGDSAVAGLVAGLSRNRPPAESVRLAVAAGTAATLRPGTSLCTAEDVERLLPQVRVQELKG